MAVYSDTKNVQAVRLDMSSEAEVQALADTLGAQLVPAGLYALVNNNNNTVVGKDGMIEWVTIDDYKRCVPSVGQGEGMGGGGGGYSHQERERPKTNHPTTQHNSQMEINLYSFIRVTKAFLPLLKVRSCLYADGKGTCAGRSFTFPSPIPHRNTFAPTPSTRRAS